jgi:hypothetical protein
LEGTSRLVRGGGTMGIVTFPIRVEVDITGLDDEGEERRLQRVREQIMKIKYVYGAY